LTSLLLLHLPTILALHIQTYWEARSAVLVSAGKGCTLVEAYHARLPLLSVDVKGNDGQAGLSPLYFTSMADALIQLYLPPEEYGATVERLMLREVLGRTVLLNVGNRLCQPWFWYQIGLKLLGDQARSPPPKPSRQTISETIYGLVMRIWTITMMAWNALFALWDVYLASPATEKRNQRCWEPWVLVLREVSGVDGRAGLQRSSWATRLVWGFAEMLIGLFGPILDR
jgi:hypothetical protein